MAEDQGLPKIIQRICVRHAGDENSVWSQMPLYTFKERTVIGYVLEKFSRHDHLIFLAQVHALHVRDAYIISLFVERIDGVLFVIYPFETFGAVPYEPVQP